MGRRNNGIAMCGSLVRMFGQGASRYAAPYIHTHGASPRPNAAYGHGGVACRAERWEGVEAGAGAGRE